MKALLVILKLNRSNGGIMATAKVSEIKDFPGKDLLLAAQKRGCDICRDHDMGIGAAAVTLIGLADILVENSAVLADLAKQLPKP